MPEEKPLRIGLIADTHVPTSLASLPDAVSEAFADVDLILHAGDITSMDVLETLGRLAPVIAVRGEKDHLDLPERQLITARGLSIGVLHGPAWALADEPGMKSRTTEQRADWWRRLLHDVERAFPRANAVVFGHAHRPYMAWHDRVLLISPGAVFHRTPALAEAELAAGQPLLRRRSLQRWLERAELGDVSPMAPSVGVLTLTTSAIRAELVSLADSGVGEDTSDAEPAPNT